MSATATAPATKVDLAIAEIERLGFKYREEAQYDVSAILDDHRVQVREAANYAPKENVERYAIQMGESQFPPVIVTRDGWVVDGNTRIAAKMLRRNKFKDSPFLPAIVLDIDYATAPTKQRNFLKALAATLNAQNGQGLTPKERRAVVVTLIEENWLSTQIARALGVGQATVTQVKQEIEAVRKMNRVGLTNGHLKGANLRALGKQPAVTLNDQPFKELATLAEEAGLNSAEIGTLAREAKDAGSDKAALDKISDLRTEMGERIREHKITGVAKPPVARMLRQHLGFINKYEATPDALVERNPAMYDQQREALAAAAKVLADVATRQQAWAEDHPAS